MGSAQGDVYADTFSVTGSGTVLKAYGNRIFARDSITIGAGAILSADGASASGNTAGIGPCMGSGGTRQNGIIGGNGGSNGNGVPWRYPSTRPASSSRRRWG
jgi:hypothetical protein